MDITELFEQLVSGLKESNYTRVSFEFPITKKDEMTSIDYFDFNVRTSNALKNAGIFSISELAEKTTTSKDLKAFKGMGTACVKEVMNALLYTCIERNVKANRKPFEGIRAY